MSVDIVQIGLSCTVKSSLYWHEKKLLCIKKQIILPDDEIVPSSLLKVQLKRFLDKISSLAVDSHTALV